MKRSYINPAADANYRKLVENLADFPFSFVYAGETYKGFGADYFTLKDSQTVAEGDKETKTFVWDFADTLEVSLILTHYYSHGVTEWTVYFENIGEQDSKVLEDLKTEVVFEGKYPSLKGMLGDHVNRFRPYEVNLTNQYVTYSADTGRATHITSPYFNLEHGDGGTMLALGWAGTWHAEFSSDGEKTTYTAGAVNGLRTYLKPGEKIRSALFVFASYAGRNEHYATNYWRDWFVRYNMPKADKEGNPVQPFSTIALSLDTGLPHSDGSISECYTTWRPSLEKVLSEGVKPDYRWLDAGWYITPTKGSCIPKGEEDWYTVGTWELDPAKWPGQTLLESTDWAREHGMKTLMWFEPERTSDPANMAKNFGYKEEWAMTHPEIGRIGSNIGDPECYEWTRDRICKTLRENKIEMFREDNNIEAAKLWQKRDTLEGENRCGITECKVIMNHYRLWDEIIECTLSYGGDGFVDSCASGGGRNDIESLRRAIVLMRSDRDRFTIGIRLSMTTTINKWIPFCGAASMCDNQTGDPFYVGDYDKFSLRSSYMPTFNLTNTRPTQNPDTDFEALRFGFAEWNKVKPYLLKEFYVLTPWHESSDTTDFTSYCFFDPETEKGYLFVFRQERCVRDTLTVALPFTDGEEYTFTDVDSGVEMRGSDRLTIVCENKRSARLFEIKK